MNQTHYDMLVIGTGPAGEGAAMKAAKSGKKVAVIEKYIEVGGGCTHWGTIPSKALRQVIYQLNTLHQNPIYRQMEISTDYSLPRLIKAADRVIRTQVDLRHGFYEHNGVRLIHGSASFVDAHTLHVSRDSGLVETFTADGIVIATGSRPYRPADIDFTHPRVLDSDTLLDIQFTPKSITIYGAGVLACEYASMLRNLGIEINLIDTRNQLLSFLDEEISDALSYHFADRNIMVRHNEEYERIEPLDECVVVHLKSGKKIRSDVLLWSNGRSGNSEGLNLAAIGVHSNSRGQIEVNENFQVKINASLPRSEGQSTDQGILVGGEERDREAGGVGRGPSDPRAYLLCGGCDRGAVAGERIVRSGAIRGDAFLSGGCGLPAGAGYPDGDLHEPGDFIAGENRGAVDRGKSAV